MKSKLLLIFLVLILSFNIFLNTNSKEKFKLAKTYLDQKNYREAVKIYLELAKEKDINCDILPIFLKLISYKNFSNSIVKICSWFQIY